MFNLRLCGWPIQILAYLCLHLLQMAFINSGNGNKVNSIHLGRYCGPDKHSLDLTYFCTYWILIVLLYTFSRLHLLSHNYGNQQMELSCLMMWMRVNLLKSLQHALLCQRMILMSCLHLVGKSPCSTWWLLRYIYLHCFFFFFLSSVN